MEPKILKTIVLPFIGYPFVSRVVGIVNTAILGALVRATGLLKLASFEQVIRNRFPKEDVAVNLAAIAKTYEVTKVGLNKD